LETKAFKSNLKIDYKKPLNYKDEWAHLFKADYAYLNVELKVRGLKNVFVNHYGLVIKNGLLVKGSAPNIGHTNYDDDNFYYRHWRKGIEQLIVSKYGKSLPSIKLDDNRKYLVIHSPWFSYYFWLTECLPRLLMVQDQLDDLVLIYPEGWKKINYVNDTLDLFPKLQRIEIPNDYHLFVKNLVMPEVKPWTPMLIPEQVFQIREFLFSKFDISTSKKERHIYISRSDAKYKKLINEDEVVNLIEKYNFETITMSDRSLKSQIKLMHETKCVMSITGASMANLLFLPMGATLIDLTNKMYLTDRKYKFHFKKIMDILIGNYVVQFCEPNVDPKLPDIAMYDIKVDTLQLEKNLNQYIY
jgi:capsular polysaccharide biosynthesis protein